jgi:hypothetical protein
MTLFVGYAAHEMFNSTTPTEVVESMDAETVEDIRRLLEE